MFFQNVLWLRVGSTNLIVIQGSWKKKKFYYFTYIIASKMPLYCVSFAPLVNNCSLVLTTSKGFTAKAAKEPDAQPDRNEHQKTASPEKKRKKNWM